MWAWCKMEQGCRPTTPKVLCSCQRSLWVTPLRITSLLSTFLPGWVMNFRSQTLREKEASKWGKGPFWRFNPSTPPPQLVLPPFYVSTWWNLPALVCPGRHEQGQGEYHKIQHCGHDDEFCEEWSVHHSYRGWIAVGLRGSLTRSCFFQQPRSGKGFRPHAQGLRTIILFKDRWPLRIFQSNLKAEYVCLDPSRKMGATMGSLCTTPGRRTTWITVVLKRGKDKGRAGRKHNFPNIECTTLKRLLRLTYLVCTYPPPPQRKQQHFKRVHLLPLRWRW